MDRAVTGGGSGGDGGNGGSIGGSDGDGGAGGDGGGEGGRKVAMKLTASEAPPCGHTPPCR